MKGGINFEEWKEIVKKNRRSLRSKSNIFRFEPESLTYGAEKAVKSPEYGQMHTITYNVTGMEIPSSWPTEIKSGKTLTLDNIIIPYGATNTVRANLDYAFANNTLTVENVLNNLEITVEIGDIVYENAKLGDYLYSDWTFGPTAQTGWLGRCVGLAEHNNGKSVWCSPKSSTTMVWSTETISTGTGYGTAPNARTAMNGKENTAILLSLGADKYPAAAWAAQQFEGNGYLPAAGLFYNDFKTIVSVYDTFRSTSFHVAGEYTNYNSWYVKFSYYTTTSPTVDYASKTSAIYVASFIDLSGKPGKPINANGHEYVDLGLPSGTLWANMNVGASSETDYGNYYMYGMGSKTYDSTDTPYAGTEEPLDLSKDTARQVWGGDWHMPTKAQCEELIANTTYQWVTDYNASGINGGLFTAQNGKSVFFPAAGYYNYNSTVSLTTVADCWSNTSGHFSDSDLSYHINAGQTKASVLSRVKRVGFPVRPVIG